MELLFLALEENVSLPGSLHFRDYCVSEQASVPACRFFSFLFLMMLTHQVPLFQTPSAVCILCSCMVWPQISFSAKVPCSGDSL